MKRFMCVLILASVVAGCATSPTPTPVVSVPTPAPTWTLQPTYTPNPTYTPFPKPTAVVPTATAAPTATPAPTPTPTPVTYVVQPGDTLNVLALQFDVPADLLILVNGIENMDIITVGQVLVIPVTPTLAISPTVSITPTAGPVVARPVAPPPVAPPPPPPPSNLIYPAPTIVYPANGTTLKFDPKQTDDITFTWLPVGQLESGQQPCRWKNQPNGTEGFIWDRYQIEFDPPMQDWAGRPLPIHNNDHGTNRTFSLLEYKPGISYTWKVAVGRWCVLRNFDNQDPKHQAFMGLASPYSEPRTFLYNP